MFAGRFVAFLRAVTPALAGLSRMRYRTFLAYNAAGGLAWGVGFVLLRYLAGSSYAQLEKSIGQGVTLAVVALVVLAAGAPLYRRLYRRRHKATVRPIGQSPTTHGHPDTTRAAGHEHRTAQARRDPPTRSASRRRRPV